MKTDIVVIGGGAAGIGSALSAYKEGLDVVLIEREERIGGVLNQCIHNGFGLHYFRKELTGPEYAEIFIEMLKNTDVKIFSDSFLHSIDIKDKKIYLITPYGVKTIETKAIVVATGARERTFGSLLIPGKRLSGIFTAGMAQKYINILNIFPGKRALILGSGDIGLIMARRLTLEGVEVVGVVERLPYPGGLLRNVVQCLEDYNIPLYLSSTVIEVRGNGRVEEVVVANVDENFKPILGTEKIFKVDTLILSVGLIPNIELLEDKVEIDKVSKGFSVNNLGQTSLDFIFASGNCTIIYDLVDYVSIEGEKAGKYAGLYVKGEKYNQKIPIKKGENIGILYPNYYTPIENLTLYIRVRKPMEKGILKVGKFEKEFKDLIPSEILRVNIKDKYIENLKEIEVSIKGE
ncbi:MAG: NAD(P)/FAD-dependent oxidoreductase [Dictyoglomaceae bacterium]|nr:NAD(P)/FAD-dependent oxidoreductase [Dictyoglomaceae bacterium]